MPTTTATASPTTPHEYFMTDHTMPIQQDNNSCSSSINLNRIKGRLSPVVEPNVVTQQQNIASDSVESIERTIDTTMNEEEYSSIQMENGMGVTSLAQENDTLTTKIKQFFKFLGPAVLISVGYVDPGNWATDIEGGSTFGYSLLWVLLVSNMFAIVLQSLSAKLGLVTKKDLSQQCSNFYPSHVTPLLWILAEVAIAATDLAEVLGTAIGLKLLFGLPLIWGVLLTAFDTLLFLLLQRLGHRITEVVILGLMTLISACFVVEMVISKPDIKGIVRGAVPSLPRGSLPVVTGILGATIMPHNLYLHSGLILSRASDNPVITKRYCRFAIVDAFLSLNMALFVNAAILIVSCASFFGKKEIVAIEDAHEMMHSLFGKAASVVFGVALLASGQSSTICGTLAGQMVMEGFVNLKVRPWIRRLITRGIAILPAVLVLVIFGERNGTSLLVWSQVILSIQLPFAMIPLIRITSHSEMKEYRNGVLTWIVGWSCVLFVIGLNIWLVIDLFISYFRESSVVVWIAGCLGCLVFVTTLGYIAFCKIGPKDTQFVSLEEEDSGKNNVEQELSEQNQEGVPSKDDVDSADLNATTNMISSSPQEQEELTKRNSLELS